MRYYIHIPFCHSKCAYCDFYSMPVGRNEMMGAFVDALDEEIDRRCGVVVHPVETLYIGGGTPSSLPVGLLGHIISRFKPDDMTELTIEVNPEDVDEAFAGFAASVSDVVRISMGVQSLNDGELSIIGRRHSADDAVRAYRRLRDGGISNISLDLIYGLPGQDLDSWKKSVDGLLELCPEHISAYLLSYEPHTRLWAMLSKGKVEEAPEDLVSLMYDYLCRATRSAGYEHYEISNFALPGRRARHNSSYWDGSEYIGLGPGAHSFTDGKRGYNLPSLKDYIATHGCGVYREDPEDDMSRFNDRLITSLRTSDGISLDELRVYPEAYDCAVRLLADGMLERSGGGRILIPEKLWLRSDYIMRELIVV